MESKKNLASKFVKTCLLFSAHLFITNCSSQVYALQEFASPIGKPQNSYLKDVMNDFNRYEGEWKYQSGLTVLTLKFRKISNRYNENRKIYEDLLIGDYQYVENGNLIIDQLENLNLSIDPYHHTLNGASFIYNSQFPPCTDCGPYDRRIKLNFRDPERPQVYAYLVMRYTNVGGIEKIEAILYQDIAFVLDETSPGTTRVPMGEYTFIKQ